MEGVDDEALLAAIGASEDVPTRRAGTFSLARSRRGIAFAPTSPDDDDVVDPTVRRRRPTSDRRRRLSTPYQRSSGWYDSRPCDCVSGSNFDDVTPAARHARPPQRSMVVTTHTDGFLAKTGPKQSV